MKWAGAIILVAASYLCGQALSGEDGKKLSAIEAMAELLKYIRRRMWTERLPLYQIFSAYEDDFLEKIGFLELMRSHRTHINNRWKQALNLLPLEKEVFGELLRFGNELGLLPLEEQIKRLDGCMDFLENEKAKLAKALPPKQKTTKTVCLLCGLLAAILLI